MKMSIFTQTHKSTKHKVKLHADRLKFEDFDAFTLHGTDNQGNNFEINFFMDSGQQFEMSTRLASSNPDNPKNFPVED